MIVRTVRSVGSISVLGVTVPTKDRRSQTRSKVRCSDPSGRSTVAEWPHDASVIVPRRECAISTPLTQVCEDDANRLLAVPRPYEQYRLVLITDEHIR